MFEFKGLRSGMGKNFGYAWRSAVFLLIIFLVLGGGAIGLFSLSVRALLGKAEKVLELYPANCVTLDAGNESSAAAWLYADNASGTPSVSGGIDGNKYNKDNSAYFAGGHSSIACAGFSLSDKVQSGEIPVAEKEPASDSAGVATTSPEALGVPTTTADFINPETGMVEAVTVPQEFPTTTAEILNPDDGTVEIIEIPQALPAEAKEILNPDDGSVEVIEITQPLDTNPAEALPDPQALPASPEPLAPEGIPTTLLDKMGKALALFGRFINHQAVAQAAETVVEKPLLAELGIFKSVKINFSIGELMNALSETSTAVEHIIPQDIEQASSTIDLETGMVETEDDPQDRIAGDRLVFWYTSDRLNLHPDEKSWRRFATMPINGLVACENLKADGACVEQALVRAMNGNQFSLDLPDVADWQDLDGLQIKVEGVAKEQADYAVYLDNLWLTVTYQAEERIEEDFGGYATQDRIFVDNQEVEFDYTDDNQGENIIIKANGKDYAGVINSWVYFSVTNISSSSENVDLQVHFPQDRGEVTELQRLKGDEWTPIDLSSEEIAPGLIQQALGQEIERKLVPEELRVNKSTQDNILIGSGKTQYYKMKIVYPLLSNGEFYIEAIGDSTGYGLLDPWWQSQWSYKLPINIDNESNPNALSDYQLQIDIPSSLTSFWRHVNQDGSDVRLVNGAETTELNFWVQSWSYAATSAKIWVKIDVIPAASTSQIFLYYGNAAAASASNMYNAFSYDTLTDMYYVVNDNLAGTSVKVVSLIDNNQVQLDGQTPVDLNRQGMTTFSSPTSTSVLRAKGPVMARIIGTDNGEALVPVSFAGTKFAVPSTRNTENFYFYSPFGEATTTLYDGASLQYTTYHATSSATTTALDIVGMGLVESTQPIFVYFDNGGPADGLVPYPATTEDLYGFRSDNNYLGITNISSAFNLRCSSGASASVSGQARGALYANTVCAGGSDGSGDAVRITGINFPLSSIQQDDGDGDESSSFLPEQEFNTEYMVPTDTAYFAVACAPRFGEVALSVFDENNNYVSSATCTPTTVNPGKAFFGTSSSVSYNAGSRLVSTNDKPFYAYYEDMSATGASGGDESNLWGAVQARSGSAVAPSASFGSEISYAELTEAHYRWRNDNGNQAAATWKAAEDTSVSNQVLNQNLRVRFSIKNVANNSATNFKYRLQTAERGGYANCGAVPIANFSDIATSTGANPPVSMYASAFFADQATTTAQLTSEGTFVPGRIVEATSNETQPITLAVGEYTEVEYAIRFTTYAKNNENYCFRVANAVPEIANYTQIADIQLVGVNVLGSAYEDEGSAVWTGCDGVTANISLVINGNLKGSAACAAGTGSFNFSNVNFSAGQPVAVFFNAAGANKDKGVVVTKTFSASADVALNPRKNRVWLKMETGATNISNTDLAFCSSAAPASCANVPFSAGGGSLVVEPQAKTVINGSTTYKPGGNITLVAGAEQSAIGGDMYVNLGAVVDSEGYGISIGGDWYNYGRFYSAGGQTVTFTATSTGYLIVQNTDAFRNVVFNGAGGSWKFTRDAIINEDFMLSAGSLVGTTSISVNGGDVTGDGSIALTGGTFVLDGNGNFGGSTDWSFTNLSFGDAIGMANTTKIGNNNINVSSILKIDLNQTLLANNNIWTLSGSSTPLILSGGFVSDNSTFRFTSSNNANIVTATYNQLEFLPTSGTPTYTILSGNLIVKDHMFVGNGTSPVTVSANANNPAIDLNGDLAIRTSSTLIASMTSGFNIAGNWSNAGVFNPNGGAVVFDSGSLGKTVNPGNSSFHKVVFNNANGGWTIDANATSTNDWVISNAQVFIATSSSVIEVRGVFSNGLGGAATTWTGATLFMNGTSSSINTKVNGADVYGNLKIGPNAQIKLWNSSAASYDIMAGGSLYSMDHAGNDGSLLVWGDYKVATGTADYWNWATDYDGASLAGSERQAMVAIASGSAVSVTGGQLEVVGSAAATTTIANQGSGNYSLRVSGGSLNANHYRLRDTDANGLYLAGSSTIVSLNNGDFELSVDGGNLITLSPAAIAANPGKELYYCRFATSTAGVSSGYNASLSAAAASTWTFVNHVGAFAGESFDNDPGDSRGYLIWDDSPSYYPRSQRWRWYLDTTNETPTTSAAAENISPSGIARSTMLKLRLTIKETNGLPGSNVKMRLQYSTFSDFSSDVSMVGEIGSTTAAWVYYNGVDSDNATATTRLLSDSDAVATHNESGTSTSSFLHAAMAAPEWEFTIRNANAATGTTYYFRAYTPSYKDSSVITNTGEAYPSLVAGNSTLVSAVNGMSSGTAVAGTVTSIDTASNGVAFGTVNIGVPITGAQRIQISTNAASGYQLFVLSPQSLMSNNGATVTPISSTNDNPQAWPASPMPAAFGYHTTDSTLSGASPSRFAADNTYAKFETMMREIGYNPLPTANDQIDLVYKLEVTDPQQAAGEYATSIEYIIVPTY